MIAASLREKFDDLAQLPTKLGLAEAEDKLAALEREHVISSASTR